MCDGHLDLGKVLRQIDHLQSYLHLSFQRIFRLSFNYFRQVSKMLGMNDLRQSRASQAKSHK